MILSGTRSFYVKLTKDLSDEQLLLIPEGFNNNILWNLGHVLVVQQLLSYGLCGLSLNVPEALVAACRPKTSPKNWQAAPERKMLEELLFELAEKFAKDYQAGLFTSFTPYTTSGGFSLSNLEEALSFNYFHEGIHLGTILALRKLVL